jgi:hypothetical protein
MVRIYHKVRETGLNNVKLGNCGVFARTAQDWEHLLKKVGKEDIGWPVKSISNFLQALLNLFAEKL